ncbi:MAG: hypothetical protein ACLUZZ_05360 [Alistipes inops]
MEYADRRPHRRCFFAGMVSLGGFGGYIVVGFDHSIQASGGWRVRFLDNWQPVLREFRTGVVGDAR